MTENEFADLIDAQLPYGDANRSRELFAIASGIGFNASLCVLYEIAIPPPSVALSDDTFSTLLSDWRGSTSDQLAEPFALYATQIRESGVGGASGSLALDLLDALDSRRDLMAGLAIISLGGQAEIETRCSKLLGDCGLSAG